MTTIDGKLRVPLMALSVAGLLAGLWAGLLRLGWALPSPFAGLAANHGALMLAGFLGALISLERAAALQRRWAYAAPALVGLGGLLLILGAPDVLSRGVIAAGSAVFVAAFVLILRLQFTGAHVTMAAGAVMWLGGNVLWLLDWPVFRATPWWLGFLLLTVAGERLELGRVLRHGKPVLGAFAVAALLYVIALYIGLFEAAGGVRIGGMALLALGAWLLRFDVARRTIKMNGLTRFIGVCLFLGYAWLIVAGALWLLFADMFLAGPLYDAMVHAVLVGFVFSMIFGHAPIILPALMKREVRYTPLFYAPLALLHASLLARLYGDLWPAQAWRMWGGLLNEVAVLAFVALLVTRVARRP
jgi:hypothetical protein